MKTGTTYSPPGIGRSLLVLIMLFASAAFANPALAYTPAEGAKILNVVLVEYEGTGGATYSANASALVTVTLAPAALTYSGAPTDGAPGDTAGTECPPDASSGVTTTALNALSANANGDDTYTVSLSGITPNQVNNESVQYRILDSTGNEIQAFTSDSTDLTDFGSSLVIGVENATTLRFDGGVDLEAMFSIGDIVVVKDATHGRVDYKVKGVDNGTAVSHENAGDIEHSDTGATQDATAYGTLELEAFEVTINGETYGSDTTPDFTNSPPSPGTIVGEMVLVEISVTADAASQTADGEVAFNFDTEDSDGSNNTSSGCTVTFYQAAELVIKKEVKNLDETGSDYGANANGAPGDTLEYRVTVRNPDNSDANLVKVTDNIPTYTTLVSDAYGTDLFAQAVKDTTTVNITMADDSTEDGTIASGDAEGTAAGNTLTFYLGDGNVGTGTKAGGTLAGGETIVITYRVIIDN